MILLNQKIYSKIGELKIVRTDNFSFVDVAYEFKNEKDFIAFYDNILIKYKNNTIKIKIKILSFFFLIKFFNKIGVKFFCKENKFICSWTFNLKTKESTNLIIQEDNCLSILLIEHPPWDFFEVKNHK